MREEKKDQREYIDRDGLRTGIVTLIKVVDKDSKLPKNAEVIGDSEGKTIVALNIRKIVFEEKQGFGTDILYRMSRKQPYSYRIMDAGMISSISEYQHNTLCIRDVNELGDVLFFSGFPDEISKDDVYDIKQMVMSKKGLLQIKAHAVTIDEQGVIDPERLIYVNSQAVSVKNFGQNELSTRPQKIEKVYTKYFK